MKDWKPYAPIGLPQFLAQETNGCTSYAAIDSIETQELAITGVQPQYSRRWLAKVSRTSKTQGNSEQQVFPAIKHFGLVLESSWPQRNDMTLDEFYADPTEEEFDLLLAEGEAWLKKWQVTDDYFVPFSYIDKAPLIARLNVTTTFHFVEVLSKDYYFDSERHNGKIGIIPVSIYPVVVDYYQITLSLKNMSNVIFVHKTGSQEYGFYVPATSVESIKDKALNYGRSDILKPDGSIDFTQAHELSGV
jgi:hypothetical protein